jgi:two-component system chemotaxis sensor kinase CheA
MAEVHHEAGGSGADFDLSQFYQIFFEEAGENLDLMEQMLLNLNLETADDEELNGIFRCAHSVKGGAATFGFSDVAELTHQMESLLDRLRRHELKPTSIMVDVLLESADASRSLLARHQAGGEGVAPPTGALVSRIRGLVAGEVVSVPPATAPAAAVSTPKPVVEAVVAVVPQATPAVRNQEAQAGGPRILEISIQQLDHPEQADAISELFRDIPGLGAIKTLPAAGANTRLFEVETTSSDDDLLDLFAFHVARENVVIREKSEEAGEIRQVVDDKIGVETMLSTTNDAQTKEASTTPSPGAAFGFFDGAPGAPGTQAVTTSPQAGAVVDDVISKSLRGNTKAATSGSAQPEAATIRVAISKVDQLINLGRRTRHHAGHVGAKQPSPRSSRVSTDY